MAELNCTLFGLIIFITLNLFTIYDIKSVLTKISKIIKLSFNHILLHIIIESESIFNNMEQAPKTSNITVCFGDPIPNDCATEFVGDIVVNSTKV